jgi:radical SAM protein with 4Fe4S-binding SPASM domain
MEIDTTYVPLIPTGVMHLERAALHLILHPSRPRWLVANRLGKEIVELADGKRDVATISRKLAVRYGKDPHNIEPEVLAFIGSLHKAGMLEAKTDGSPPTSGPVDIRGVFLHLTDKCNLRCIHCYVGSATRRRRDLSAGKIRDLIDELADMGGRSITMSGGEPLLRPDWHELVGYAARKLSVTINTNATLITPRIADMLGGLRPYIQISLDGPDPETHDGIRGKGTFALTVAGIRGLQQAGLAEHLILSMTLMSANISRAPEMIDFAASLGIPKVRFLPLHRQGRAISSKHELDAPRDAYFRWFRHVYLERKVTSPPVEVYGGLIGFLLHTAGAMDESWCSIGRSVVVDSQGDVHPCALLMDPRLALGNIYDAGLRQIGASPKLRGLTQACLSRRDIIPKCRMCIWRNLCRASCPAFPFLEKGTFRATDDFCDFRQQLYEDAIFGIAGERSRNSGEDP